LAAEAPAEGDESGVIAEGEDAPTPAASAGENLEFVEELSGEIDLEASGDLLGAQGLDFAGVPEAEPDAAGVDSMLREIVEAYIQEGAFRQALDLCRKAEGLGGHSAWLDSQIRILEEKAAGDEGGYLPETSEGDNKAASLSTVPPGEVVKALEGWLRTIERRKAEMPSGPEGE
jgi:hypothetical protein